MSVEEAILFVAVIALGLALVVVVVAPKVKEIRRRKDEPKGDPPRAVPGPVHARGHQAADVEPLPPPVPVRVGPPPAPQVAGAHLVCPTCRRAFAAGLRFCPYDARLLTPEGAGGPTEAEREPSTDPDLMPATKICPTCARRYQSVAVVCARDGAPLVSVN